MSMGQTASIDSIIIIVKRTTLVMPELAHQTTIFVNTIVIYK